MNCSNCQTTNPAESKFCMKCGSALEARCPSCGTELPADALFCFKCGASLAEPEGAPDLKPAQASIEQYIPAELMAKLESARASGGMQGERRVVSILFCDVEGSTAAAEKLDPEEWAEIMNGAFEHLISPVYRYEGTLARLMGDAILAFFGAPIGHEDDPQRAVMAGLDIIQDIAPYRQRVQEDWGLEFNVRVGINTGLVVVGEVGSDLRVEYTAQGDAVNLASRMEQSAAPGTVQITEDTHRLVAPLFEFQDLGGIEVKGKSEPVRSYQVLRRREVPGQLRGIEGLSSPLVGREKEMEALQGFIGELHQGRGQLFSVMGEAGLGKSRLMAELRKSLDSAGVLDDSDIESRATGNGVAWYEGRSQSYETTTPYAPIISLLGSMFGIRTEQADTEKYGRIFTRLSNLMPDRAGEVAPFIASVMGVQLAGEEAERVRYLQPPQLREKVFEAVSDLFEWLAMAGPKVLVFEDLHWMDPTSLDLLERLMPLSDRVSLAIVCVFRPWRQEPSWRFHEAASRDYSHRYNSVLLEPLDQDSSRELVANLLEVEDLPATVRALILTKAEGNPFFVEEVIRSLLDAGLVVRENSHWRATREIERLAVPDTLAGVITARLDQLDEESKRVLQTASVLGREFHFDALSRVHDSIDRLDLALTDVQRRELVRETSRVPTRVYMFKHAMTQETAYDSLLLSRRRELHGRVAGCLEQIEPDRVNEIARHLVAAREMKRALPYLVSAGERAAGSYSTEEAIGFFNQALEVLETEEDSQLARRAYEGLGGVLTFSFDVPGAIETYDKMFNAAKGCGDRPMQVSALNKLGYITALMKGELPQGEQLLVDAESLANDCGDLSGLAELHMTYCYIRTVTGDFDNATDHLSEAAEIGRKVNMEEARLFGMTHTANTLMYMTRFDEGWTAIQEAKQEAEKVGNRKYLSELLALTTPLYHLRNGDLDAAWESAQKGADLAAQIGALVNESAGTNMLGQIASMRGDYEAAIAFQERALVAGQGAGYPYLQVSALCSLGAAYLEISPELRHKTAEYHGQAMEIMELPLGMATGASAWSELGFCALALGDLDMADELFQKGLNNPSAPMHMLRPRLLIGSAFVALAQAKLDEASRFVGGARGLAEAGSMKQYLPYLAFADAQLSVGGGELTHALAHFERAEELALDMQLRPMVWQARAGASQVLSAMERQGEAEEMLASARATIDEEAALFKDEGLREMYVQHVTGKLAASST